MTTLSRITAALVLTAIALQGYFVLRAPAGVDRYQQNIRAASIRVPRQIGPWVGEDVKVPVQAVSTLRPNVILNRRYVNVENGATAGVMLVHCSDAHHMVGHYPLRCYPAQGWDLQASRPRDWTIDGRRMPCTEYEFTKEEEGPVAGQRCIVIDNCLLRPDGAVLRDMDALSQAIGGADGAAFGAGQIQIYFDAAMPREQRDSATQSLMRGYQPVINAILARVSTGSTKG